MDIETIREYALGLDEQVTEDLFAEQWISWRIRGKWFLLMQLDAPEPRIAVKLPPEVSIDLRERHAGVRPAYHMNKKHWSDLYLDQLPDDLVKAQISASFHLASGKAKKANHL